MRTLSILAAILTTLPFCLCAAQTNASASNSHAAFVQTTVYGNITFAATVVRDVGDLYFHIEAPADNSWVGFGVGSEMLGSLMWIFYRNADKNGVTLCTRTAEKHIEPAHIQDSGCDFFTDNAPGGVQNGLATINDRLMFVANIRCSNFTSASLNNGDLNGGKRHEAMFPREEKKFASNDDFPKKQNPAAQRKLDLSGAGQGFIFALGPTDRRLASDKKGAPLRRHSMFGRFSLDLSDATVDTTEEIPKGELSTLGSWQNKDSQLVEGPTADRGGWRGTVHAMFMCSTIVVLFPIGVIFLRLLDNVIWHAWMQGLGCLCIVSGVAVGAWASRSYNQYRAITSPHQILGLTIASFILIQFGIGITHHYLYTHASRSTILRRIHVPLGATILVAGAANGFLGLWLTGGTYHLILYACIVGVVFTGLIGAVVWIKIVKKREWRRKKDRREGDEEFRARKYKRDYESLPEGGDTPRVGAYEDAGSIDIADRNAYTGRYHGEDGERRSRESGGEELELGSYEDRR